MTQSPHPKSHGYGYPPHACTTQRLSGLAQITSQKPRARPGSSQMPKPRPHATPMSQGSWGSPGLSSLAVQNKGSQTGARVRHVRCCGQASPWRRQGSAAIPLREKRPSSKWAKAVLQAEVLLYPLARWPCLPLPQGPCSPEDWPRRRLSPLQLRAQEPHREPARAEKLISSMTQRLLTWCRKLCTVETVLLGWNCF